MYINNIYIYTIIVVIYYSYIINILLITIKHRLIVTKYSKIQIYSIN